MVSWLTAGWVLVSLHITANLLHNMDMIICYRILQITLCQADHTMLILFLFVLQGCHQVALFYHNEINRAYRDRRSSQRERWANQVNYKEKFRNELITILSLLSSWAKRNNSLCYIFMAVSMPVFSTFNSLSAAEWCPSSRGCCPWLLRWTALQH